MEVYEFCTAVVAVVVIGVSTFLVLDLDPEKGARFDAGVPDAGPCIKLEAFDTGNGCEIREVPCQDRPDSG